MTVPVCTVVVGLGVSAVTVSVTVPGALTDHEDRLHEVAEVMLRVHDSPTGPLNPLSDETVSVAVPTLLIVPAVSDMLETDRPS